ncbi:CHAT domain-containing protein [Streptomyces sp. NPDC001599]|uniref:CHAT domain-containing protein n=1 Tax=Streptomyces sp. NPDC001599 TaxID=3364591 RepID=UPI0036D0317B
MPDDAQAFVDQVVTVVRTNWGGMPDHFGTAWPSTRATIEDLLHRIETTPDTDRKSVLAMRLALLFTGHPTIAAQLRSDATAHLRGTGADRPVAGSDDREEPPADRRRVPAPFTEKEKEALEKVLRQLTAEGKVTEASVNSPGDVLTGPRSPARLPGAPEPRHLMVELAEQAPPGWEVPLHVQVVRAAHESVSTPLSPFTVADGGTRLVISVHAPGLLTLGHLQQELTVSAGQDSEVLRFGLRTTVAGLHTVIVRAYLGGSCLGELRVQISVRVDTPGRDGPTHTAPLAPLTTDPGEATLQVLRDSDGTFSFQLLSETRYAPESFHMRAGDPREATERIYDELRRTAAASLHPGRLHPRRAQDRLRALGAELWAAAVPDAVRRQFWEEVRDFTSVTILGEHNAVPWELMYPVDGSQEGDGFLAEWLPVVRQVFGQPRVSRLPLPRATFVVPPGSPPEARQEVEQLRQRLPDAVAYGGIVTDQEALGDLIDQGLGGLLHFACHNTFDSGGSRVVMADGDFTPVDLSLPKQRGALQATHPLVFFNACRSAGEIDWFAGTLSWGSQFLQAGAGAFIGSLWPVRSDSALTFADAFYYQLVTEGQPLGRAALEARRVTRSDDGDPTRLAYAVYGSPTARATPPPSHAQGVPLP